MAATISNTDNRWTFSSPIAVMVLATNNSESPGRNGVMTTPVSRKMIRKKDCVRPKAVFLNQCPEMLVQVYDEIKKPRYKFHANPIAAC